MPRFDRWEWMKEQLYAKKTLYDDISNLTVYRYHRENLRPWDRRLPPMVEQEANRRQLWSLKPPTATRIVGMLLMCIFLFQIIGIVPVLINSEHMNIVWNDIEKPGIVYHDTSVLLACWVVVMLCNGLTMWFIWLAEGFDSHQLEMIPFAALTFLLCTWLDILFYTQRIDWAMNCWIGMLIFSIISQILLARNGVEIGAIFLCPMDGACIAAIIYCVEFMKIFGDSFEKII